MIKKDMSNLTPVELMELAKNPIQKKKDKHISPVKDFIISEGITAGEHKVPGLVIYDRYLKWCKDNSIVKISISKFFEEFKLHFTKGRSLKNMYYLLGSEGFDLSPENLRVLASEHRKRISKYGKAKKSKKENSQED